MKDMVQMVQSGVTEQGSYWSFLYKSIPTDFVTPFLEGNVLGVLFLAGIIGLAMQGLPNKEHHKTSFVRLLLLCHYFAVFVASFIAFDI